MNKLCKRCNLEPVYENYECCENCLNVMLLGGSSYVFQPDENFFKEIHYDNTNKGRSKH